MREILCVRGGNVLEGEVSVSGAKNSLVALIPAALTTKSVVVLKNVKPIDDTYTFIKILDYLGIKTEYDNKSSLYIDAREINNKVLNIKEMGDMRASYYFMGSLLSIYDDVSIALPGGCNFGERPIDLHLDAFSCLGFDYELKEKICYFKKKRERVKEISFKKKSVGATINAILASCRIEGSVVFHNCALEPEVDDLITFLNKCGGCVKREGENIIVCGVKKFHGCDYEVMSDRIEAGTFMIIGAMLAKKIKINNVKIEHCMSLINILKDIGANIEINENNVVISKGEKYKKMDVVVEPFPGFPTDLQQPLTVLLSLCEGVSTIKETIYPARLSHIDSLNKMGADIKNEKDLIIINGNRTFYKACVSGKELRGGISLVMAALLAKGESEIGGVKYIKRGYSELVEKLRVLGANVRIKRRGEK